MVDGGVSDNLGMRAILEGFEHLESSPGFRRSMRIDTLHRIAVIVVNSLSNPSTGWDKSERPPNDLQLLLKATGVPIDRYSYEAVELLKDMIYRWQIDARPALRAVCQRRQPIARARRGRTSPTSTFSRSTFHSTRSRQTGARVPDGPADIVRAASGIGRPLRAAAGKILRDSARFPALVQAMNNSRPAKMLPRPAIDIR